MMEQSSDADFRREMIGYSAQRLMEIEVGGLTGAAPGQKSADPMVRLERQGRSALFAETPPDEV